MGVGGIALVASNAIQTINYDNLDFSILISSINDGVEHLLPIGFAVMAVMIGISMIPRIIYKRRP